MYVHILYGRLPWDGGLGRPDGEIRNNNPDPSVRAMHEESMEEKREGE